MPCALEGFHLRLAGGGRSGGPGRVVGISSAHFIVQDEPKGGWHAVCYVVTAYPLSRLAAAESKPSPKICIHETSKTVTIKADKARGYTGNIGICTATTIHKCRPSRRSGSDLIVGDTFFESNQSQTNSFQRAAYAFDLSAIAGNSLFGGSFAYTGPGQSHPQLRGSPSCSERLGEQVLGRRWGRSAARKVREDGSTVSWPINKLVESWNRSTPFVLLLEEVNGVGYAEYIKSSVVPYTFSCQAVIINPRLLLRVGVTE